MAFARRRWECCRRGCEGVPPRLALFETWGFSASGRVSLAREKSPVRDPHRHFSRTRALRERIIAITIGLIVGSAPAACTPETCKRSLLSTIVASTRSTRIATQFGSQSKSLRQRVFPPPGELAWYTHPSSPSDSHARKWSDERRKVERMHSLPP
jgi:hypothetical protein